MDRKLQGCMSKMKAFVEEVDFDALERQRREDGDYIAGGFEEQRLKRARCVAAFERREAAEAAAGEGEGPGDEAWGQEEEEAEEGVVDV